MPPHASEGGQPHGGGQRRRTDGSGRARRLRNLALLPGAKATASSTIPGHAIHKVSHLNDGWYGNGNSWVAAAMPAWVEIDLGAVFTVSQVWLSNDQSGEYTDRGARKLRILAAADRDPSSSAAAWKMVAQERDSSLLGGSRLLLRSGTGPVDSRRGRREQPGRRSIRRDRGLRGKESLSGRSVCLRLYSPARAQGSTTSPVARAVALHGLSAVSGGSGETAAGKLCWMGPSS